MDPSKKGVKGESSSSYTSYEPSPMTCPPHKKNKGTNIELCPELQFKANRRVDWSIHKRAG